MMKVILDTNFLVYCAENKIDYKSELEELVGEGHVLVVLEQSLCELAEIIKNGKKLSDRDAAELAIQLLEHNNVLVEKGPGSYADASILELVRTSKEPVIIATLDAGLRKKLKNNRKIVIVGKRKLAFS